MADFGERPWECECQRKIRDYYGQGERANYLKAIYGTLPLGGEWGKVETKIYFVDAREDLKKSREERWIFE
jgi:hypothetical protein